jgi:hypothetical protein
LEIRRAENTAPAIEGTKGADSLYVCTGALPTTNRVQIKKLALAARLPTLHREKEYAKAGALISYGGPVISVARRRGLERAFRQGPLQCHSIL